jgi:hypothetical protein
MRCGLLRQGGEGPEVFFEDEEDEDEVEEAVVAPVAAEAAVANKV